VWFYDDDDDDDGYKTVDEQAGFVIA